MRTVVSGYRTPSVTSGRAASDADDSTSDVSHALKTTTNTAIDEILKISEKVDRKLKILAEKEENWIRVQEVMRQHAEEAADIVELNVGGQVFATKKSNLLKQEGSYFHAMLCSGQWVPNNKGAYFIDISPEFFKYVLDFVRTDELPVEDLDEKTVLKIRELFDYFQLVFPEPDLICRWDPDFCGSGLVFSNENTSVMCTADGCNCALGNRCVSFYSVALHTVLDCMIGFSTKKGFSPNAYNHTKCGFYISTANGRLYSQRRDNGKRYAVGFNLEDVVTCIYDKTTDTISFERNGCPLGVAFTQVLEGEGRSEGDAKTPTEILFPAVCLYNGGSGCTLLEPVLEGEEVGAV